MVRILSEEDAVLRPHLVEYDRLNPSPHFTLRQIQYIESLPNELSDRDLDKLKDVEWFILNRNVGYLISSAIPGLRSHPDIEVIYAKRFSAETYWNMINSFLAYVPSGFPQDQIGRCNLPGYRLTSPDGAQFYPIEFNGDLTAWRKRLNESARVHGTQIGHFEHGKFVLSDGQRIQVADMAVKRVEQEPYPPDF